MQKQEHAHNTVHVPKAKAISFVKTSSYTAGDFTLTATPNTPHNGI
jgi:hypothetical protein